MAFIVAPAVGAFSGVRGTQRRVPRRLRAPLALRRGRVHMTDSQFGSGGDEAEAEVSAGMGTEDVIDVSAATRTMSTEELKRDLFVLAGACDRGFHATPSQRGLIIDTVAQLEHSAPCDSPNADPRLLGEWALVYTNALDVISLALLGPVAAVAGVYQNVFTNGEEFDVVNVVELEPPVAPVANAFFDRTVARLEVFTRGVKSDDRRVDITFERAKLRQECVVGMEVPEKLFPALSVPLKAQVGWIETTFLDDEIRVARAPAGSLLKEGGVFVLRRVMDSGSGYE